MLSFILVVGFISHVIGQPMSLNCNIGLNNASLSSFQNQTLQVSVWGDSACEYVLFLTHETILVRDQYRLISITGDSAFNVTALRRVLPDGSNLKEQFTYHSFDRLGWNPKVSFAWTPDLSSSWRFDASAVTLEISFKPTKTPLLMSIAFDTCSLSPEQLQPSLPGKLTRVFALPPNEVSALLRAPAARVGQNGVMFRRCSASESFAVFEIPVVEALTRINVELMSEVGAPPLALLPGGYHRLTPIWGSAPQFDEFYGAQVADVTVERSLNGRFVSLFAFSDVLATSLPLVVDLTNIPVGSSFKVSVATQLCLPDKSVLAWPWNDTLKTGNFRMLSADDSFHTDDLQEGPFLNRLVLCKPSIGGTTVFATHEFSVPTGSVFNKDSFGTLILRGAPFDLFSVQLSSRGRPLPVVAQRLTNARRFDGDILGLSFDLTEVTTKFVTVSLRGGALQTPLTSVDFAWFTYDCQPDTMCPFFKTVPVMGPTPSSKTEVSTRSFLRVLMYSSLFETCTSNFVIDDVMSDDDLKRTGSAMCLTSPDYQFGEFTMRDLFPTYSIETIAIATDPAFGNNDNDRRARDAASNIIPVLGAVFGNLCCIVCIIAVCVFAAREMSQRRQRASNVVQMNAIPPAPANVYPGQAAKTANAHHAEPTYSPSAEQYPPQFQSPAPVFVQPHAFYQPAAPGHAVMTIAEPYNPNPPPTAPHHMI